MPQKYTQIGLIIANHTKSCCERDAEGKVNLLRGHCRHIWHRSHNSDFGSPNSSFPASPIAFLVNSPSYRLLVLSLTFLVFFILIIPFFLFPFPSDHSYSSYYCSLYSRIFFLCPLQSVLPPLLFSSLVSLSAPLSALLRWLTHSRFRVNCVL